LTLKRKKIETDSIICEEKYKDGTNVNLIVLKIRTPGPDNNKNAYRNKGHKLELFCSDFLI